MKTATLGLCVSFVLAFGVSWAETTSLLIYQNDFSTRESAAPVASTNWVVSYYATNDVLLTSNHNVKAETISRGNLIPWQDGWFKMHRGKTYASNNSNLGLWHVRDDNGNAYASYSATNETSQTLHAHPIQNAFTCGVIRTTFDVRIPKKVHLQTGARLSFTLGTKNMMVETASRADMVTTGTPYSGVMKKSFFEAGFGVFNYGPADEKGARAIVAEKDADKVMGMGWEYGRDAAGTAGMKSGPWPSAGKWARVILTADLDANTYDVSLASMTEDHPTFDSNTGTPTTQTGRGFYASYDPAVDGPITGLMFHNVYGSTGAYEGPGRYYPQEGYDDDYSFKMDNIKMEWKAPDAADFETFYKNDFNTCSRRTLSPAGTTSADYVVTTGNCTDSLDYFSSYVMPYGNFSTDTVTKQIVDACSSTAGALNNVGFDGWRRADGSGYYYLTTVDKIRVLANAKGVRNWIVHQLCENVTNGVVKFEYDMRCPSRMYNGGSTAQQGVNAVGLAGPEAWALRGNPKLYQRSSMCCKDKTDDGQKEVYPFLGQSVSDSQFAKTADTKLTSQNWYRMALVYNLDTTPRTITMTCTEIGQTLIGVDAAPAAGAWSVTTNMDFSSTAFTGLGTVVIGGYSAVGTNITEIMLTTNLKVTKNVGTANEKVIYKNDFSTRTHYMEDVSTTLIASYSADRMFDGVDTWQRNNSNAMAAYLTSGENQALMSSSDEKELGYFAQSIGTKCRKGEYLIRVDVRVPPHWRSKDGWCDLLFGNDMLKTGTCNLEKPNNVYNHMANALFTVNFHPLNDTTGAAGLWRKTRFSLSGGASYAPEKNLTTNHWYRCVCRLNLYRTGAKARTVDTALYDMGLEHPTLETPTPETPVASAEGLALATSNHGGPDAFALSTIGFRFRDTFNYAFWQNDESGSPLIDNIRIEKLVRGGPIIIR